MKKYKKFDRYGNELDDDDVVARHGQSLHAPTRFMDAQSDDVQHGVTLASAAMAREKAQRQIHDGRGRPAGHRPGYCFNNDEAARSAAESAYEEKRRLLNAWRDPVHTANQSPGTIPWSPPHPTNAAEAEALREESYRRYVERISTAWKQNRGF